MRAASDLLAQCITTQRRQTDVVVDGHVVVDLVVGRSTHRATHLAQAVVAMGAGPKVGVLGVGRESH
jgi:hypothetical protein